MLHLFLLPIQSLVSICQLVRMQDMPTDVRKPVEITCDLD